MLMGQMDRAERRRRAERAQARRDRQWRELYGTEPRQPGRGRKLSHLDCGRPGCEVCSQHTRPEEPRWDEERSPRRPGSRRAKRIVVEYRRVNGPGTRTPRWTEWKKYATMEAALKAIAALNHSWKSCEFRLKPGQENR